LAAADVREINGRLQQSGIETLEAMGDDLERPIGIAYRRPSDSGYVDVLWDSVERPISFAISELARTIGTFDQLSRLHSAMIDLEIIRDAATELAKYRHRSGGEEQPAHDPYVLVEQVAEVGIVVLYARAWTGRARIGDRWLLESEPDRTLHAAILKLRQEVHAHADFTPERGLVDTNAMLGIEGPPIYAEFRSRLSREQLEAIATLADRQHTRLWHETAELKRALGSPATE
jgi:hypothetical protein